MADIAGQIVVGFPSIYLCIYFFANSEMFSDGAGFIGDEQ